MSRFISLLIVGLLGCQTFAQNLAQVVPENRAQAPRTARPNVVLIVADDLGYSDLACYGSKEIRTPHLDAMAKEGLRFTNFCVAQAVCTASRAALMTGCYPNRIGMAGALNHTSKVGIGGEEYLLPEVFRTWRYRTACFGKWHLGTLPQFYPTRNGFDTWQGLPYSNDNGPLHPTVKGIPALPFVHDDKVIETDPDQSQFTRRFTAAAIDFMEANHERPFFLYVPHVMPHVPIFAANKPGRDGERALYTQVVEELDASVGDVLAAIKRLGIDERTIVIFMSDNGPFLSYGNHAGRAEPLREGKLTTFEGGVRVPFIIRWPGVIPAGQVRDELLTGLDLLPSLATVCDAAPPVNRIDGRDYSALLIGKPGARGRDVFAYYSGNELHAIRRGNWKLHFPHDYITVNGPPGKDGKPANFEHMKPESITESGIRGIASRHGYRVEKLPLSLFDLSKDVGETTNVVDEHPQVVAELRQLAARIRQDVGDSLTGQSGSGRRPAARVE